MAEEKEAEEMRRREAEAEAEKEAEEKAKRVADEMRMREAGENLIRGVMGYYEIDRTICLQGQDISDDWNFVKITHNAATNTFTWANMAGVSWTMSPISGSGGWDTTQLTVGNDNPYFMDGYTSARIEWVSSEGISFFHQHYSQKSQI